MSFTVFLGNLPVWVTADDIRGWLTAENLVADAIKVIRNPETQESKGFAFIDAPNTEEMNAIIRRFDRAPLEDRLLRANPAQPPRPKGQGQPPGRPTGPPGSGFGYGGPSHAPTGHSSGHGPSSGASSGSGGHASTSGQSQGSGQPTVSVHGPASGQSSGTGPSAGSPAASGNGGDLRPPPRRRKGSAKRPSSGGPQSPFAEELAKAL
ncbi:MAG TPA: RNA-binding protein [Bryobacteraceae bacterium]